MEKAILMMDYLNVTQSGNGSFSHKGDLAIDIAGKDSGIDYLKAPFTGKIKRIYSNVNAVWLESIDKVIYADGSVDYMTVMTLHDDDISNLKVGDIIKQGEIYYKEGSTGYVTGNHIHLAVGRGKFKGNGWYKNSYGNWCINNQMEVAKALFIPNNTKIINGGGFNWIRENSHIIDNTYKVVKGDTLTSIAKKYNTTVDELVELNNIKNKNLIKIGNILKIPNNNVKYFKKYTGNSVSIVDILKSLNEDYSYEYRNKIGSINGINNYTGTSKENNTLVNLIKQGILIKP